MIAAMLMTDRLLDRTIIFSAWWGVGCIHGRSVANPQIHIFSAASASSCRPLSHPDREPLTQLFLPPNLQLAVTAIVGLFFSHQKRLAL
jgi:hypothetical protein